MPYEIVMISLVIQNPATGARECWQKKRPTITLKEPGCVTELYRPVDDIVNEFAAIAQLSNPRPLWRKHGWNLTPERRQ